MSASQYPCPEFLPFEHQRGVCARCGSALTGRARRWCSPKCQREWQEQHAWNMARHAAKVRDGWKCVRCGSRTALEVNHIAPRCGEGYGWGCWNHLSNLETLCHECHVEVTTKQIRGRRAQVGRLAPMGAEPLFEVSA